MSDNEKLAREIKNEIIAPKQLGSGFHNYYSEEDIEQSALKALEHQQATITEQAQEIHRLQWQSDGLMEACNRMQYKINHQERRIAELKSLANEYGYKHEDYCEYPHGGECSCGLMQSLKGE